MQETDTMKKDEEEKVDLDEGTLRERSTTSNYPPRKNLSTIQANNYAESFFYCTKGAIGTGILALPQTFFYSGWIVGIISTLAISTLIGYSLDLLAKLIDIICKLHNVHEMSYGSCMHYAFLRGPKCLKPLAQSSSFVLEGLIIFFEINVCATYIIFMAENLRQVFSERGANWDIRVWISILYVPLLIISLVPDLRRLNSFCVVGNIFCFVAIIIIMYLIIKDLPPLEDRRYAIDLEKYPLCIGSLLYATLPVTVSVNIEASMKDPKKFRGILGVLSTSMVTITALNLLLGFFGYWRYGEKCESSITVNLPNRMDLANSARLLYVMASFITYHIHGLIPVDILWNYHLKRRVKDKSKLTFYEYLIRLINVTLTVILSVALPQLGQLITFSGSLIGVLSLTFPALLEFLILWPDQLGFLKWIAIKDFVLITLGIIILVSGTITSIIGIIRQLNLQ